MSKDTKLPPTIFPGKLSDEQVATLKQAMDERHKDGGSIFIPDNLLPAPSSATDGIIHEIKNERERQVREEGYAACDDDRHVEGELAEAAAAYALQSAGYDGEPHWPWLLSTFKPRDCRRNLIRAGALIVAEIERIDRLTGTVGDSVMNVAGLNLICTACLTVVCGVMLFVNIGIHHDTNEALRLLRRGDKIDCRMSEMKGTQPMDDVGPANVVRPDVIVIALHEAAQ